MLSCPCKSIHWNGTWPHNPPRQFILVVADMTVEAFSEEIILKAIEEAGFTLVDRQHSTTDWAEYHVRRDGWHPTDYYAALSRRLR